MEEKNQKNIDKLVEAAQNGNVEAFGDLYDIFLAEIYRFVYYKVLHKEIAEDLTEDIFFKVWQNLNKYKKTQFKFSSWLYRVAHNTVIDYVRKENIFIEEIDPNLSDEKTCTKKNTENYFNHKILTKVLQSLPENQKEAVILKYINDLTNKEIAEVLKKSETAVRILLSRALKKMQELIKKYF